MGVIARLVGLDRRSWHPRDPALAEWLMGRSNTAAGAVVNEATALNVVAVFAAVDILARTLASLPLPVYRRLRPRGKERAPDHPLYRILHDQWNPIMTSFEASQALMGHLATWGNAYAEIERDRAGRVIALWPLRPDRMRVELMPDADGRPTVVYWYTLPNGQQVALPRSRVLHLRGLSSDGIIGYSPIRMAREAIGLAIATERFGASFFGSGSRPGGILKTPKALSDEARERLRREWEMLHQGLDRAHRTAVLEEGIDWQQVGIPPEDAQFLQTRRFQIEEIARLYHIPPHMLADLERATFSNIEHQGIEFVVHTMRPWLVCWEKAILRDLFTEAERQEYFAEFLVDGLLRGDTESRYRAYATARQWGWMSANDIRELENMNPIPGGDQYLVPLNMVPASEAGQVERAQVERALEHRGRLAVLLEQRSVTERRRLARTYRRILTDVAERVVKREASDVRQLADRWLRQRAVSDFLVDLDRFYVQHEDFVRRRMAPVYAALGEGIREVASEEVGWNSAPTPDWEAFLAAYLRAMTSRWIGSSRGQLRAVVITAQELGEDVYEAIRRRLDEWLERRPGKFGMWESVQAAAAFAKATYAEAGVTRIRWVNFNPSCPYCQSLHGKVVEIHGAFIESDTDYQPEGAARPLVVTTRIGHPPCHGGCDCGLAPETSSTSSRGRPMLRSLVETIEQEYRWFEDTGVTDHASCPAP